MKNKDITPSEGFNSEKQKNNNNPNNGDVKMTRQQRRKLEREKKKGNYQRLSSEKPKNTRYQSGLGFTICDLETMKTYGMIPIGVNSSAISDTQLNGMSVYQNIFLIDVENNGVSSSCILRFIHNVKESMYDEEVLSDLLFSVLASYINSPQNLCRKTLNHNTRFRPVTSVGSELDSSVLSVLEEYLEKASVLDDYTLTSMITELGQTG